MSNISINVEFLAGTSIEEAIIEARQLAVKLGVAFVSFKFNGVRCSISDHADVDKLVKTFHKALKDDFKHIVG